MDREVPQDLHRALGLDRKCEDSGAVHGQGQASQVRTVLGLLRAYHHA